MTALPAAGYASDSSRTKGDEKTVIEAIISAIKEVPGGAGIAAYTLSSNAFTPANNGCICQIDTSGGGSSDTLKNIATTNIRDGQILVLMITNNGRTINVQNGAGGSGQIYTQDSANCNLTNTLQRIAVQYNATTGFFYEIWRTQNIDTSPVAGVAANLMYAGPSSGGSAKPGFRSLAVADVQAVHNTTLGWQALATTGITSNVITPTAACHQIDTSSSSQQINSINPANFTSGKYLILSINNVANSLTIKNQASGAANPITLAGGVDVTLATLDQSIMLQLQGTSWREIGRFGFSASAGALQGICQARLTLTSGTPVTTSDVTGAGTLYFTPTNGNQVATYNGSTWTLNSLTEKSLSLATCIKWQNYDVFLVDGTLALETAAWKSVSASNNPASGSNVVVNVSDTSGVAVGDVHTVSSTSYGTQELAIVSSFVTNTSITYAALANSYTTPVLFYQARATALTTQNGVYVKSGATNRLYVGTIRATAGNGSTGGTTEDSAANRFVWNNFNRERRSLFAKDTTTSWTYGTTTWRPANANTTAGTGRTQFVIGIAGEFVDAEYRALVVPSGGTFAVGLNLDSTTATPLNLVATASSNVPVAVLRVAPNAGFHFLQNMEWSNASQSVFGQASTWQSTLGTSNPTCQTGAIAA